MTHSTLPVTRGATTFGPVGDQALFRINPDISLAAALEHSSQIMGCVKRLTLQAAMDNDMNAAYAANVLSDLAKAIIDDLETAMAGAEQHR